MGVIVTKSCRQKPIWQAPAVDGAAVLAMRLRHDAAAIVPSAPACWHSAAITRLEVLLAIPAGRSG